MMSISYFYIGNTPFANLKHNIKDKVSNSWFKFLQKLDKILKESTKKVLLIMH